TPSDDDLSWLLRHELHAEAARLTAAQDGLRQIRGQLGSRSVFQRWRGGLRVDAVRYGLRARHLLAEAGSGVLAALRYVAGLPSRSETGERSGTGLVWLRPVVALAAVCLFAGTAAAVPGRRHAITNIGSCGGGGTTSVYSQSGAWAGSARAPDSGLTAAAARPARAAAVPTRPPAPAPRRPAPTRPRRGRRPRPAAPSPARPRRARAGPRARARPPRPPRRQPRRPRRPIPPGR